MECYRNVFYYHQGKSLSILSQVVCFGYQPKYSLYFAWRKISRYRHSIFNGLKFVMTSLYDKNNIKFEYKYRVWISKTKLIGKSFWL